MFKLVLTANRPLYFIKHNLLKRNFYICNEKCRPCVPVTQVTIIQNGIRVATEYRPSPLACTSLYIEAGSRFETTRNNGISHLIEHMAYKGFCSMSQCKLEQLILNIGAKMTTKTTREIQTFTAQYSPENAADIADVLAGIITDLELSNTAIETEKYNICLEMVDSDNDPKAVTFDYLHQTAFQGTPLSQGIIGPTRNVKKFDRDSAVNFLCEHYQPYKLCMVSSGDLVHEEMVHLVEQRLGHLVGEAACESDYGPCRFTGSQIAYRDDSMPFAHVAIAFEAPGYTSPDYTPLLVARHLIGGWHKSQGGGLSNGPPLARAAAYEGLCESFESFYIVYKDIGLWGIYFICSPMRLEDMLANVQDQWMKLCLCTQYTDIERAINSAKLNLARSVDSCVNSCHDLGTQLLYTCSRRSVADKFDELMCLKVESVTQNAEKILYDRCPAVAAVGPVENLPDYTRIRAGQYWLRF